MWNDWVFLFFSGRSPCLFKQIFVCSIGNLTFEVLLVSNTILMFVLKVEDEFFVHFLAPTELKAIPKDIVFVLDTSSSMSGTPIRELQKSMITILEKLAPEDRFNILVFQTTFGLLESELQNVSKPSIKNAKNMIKHMSPSGGKNYN